MDNVRDKQMPEINDIMLMYGVSVHTECENAPNEWSRDGMGN